MGEDLDNLSADRRSLLEEKLGALLNWRKPDLRQMPGPFAPAAFDFFAEKRDQLARACVDRVKALSDAEAANILNNDTNDSSDVAKQWSGFLASDIESARKLTPPWHIGGFGHPDYASDLAYWSKLPSFSVAELTCLTVGVDPKHFPAERFKEFSMARSRPMWESLQFLCLRHEQLSRAFFAYGPKQTINADRFLDWATRVEYEADAEFLRLLKKYNAVPSAEAPLGSNEPTPNKREIDSVAQLFTAMAIEYFGHDPKAKKSPATREIQDLAASMGISISDDTVRKYLNIGASFIDGDWNPREP